MGSQSQMGLRVYQVGFKIANYIERGSVVAFVR